MSFSYLTSSTLIETVKREGMLPTSQSTFTDEDFLQIANQETRIGLVPSILQHHEEYYVRDSADIDLVASQSNYAIPYRAIGGKFRELFYKDTSGNLRSMSRISPDDRPYYQDTNLQNSFVYFYVQGNDVVLCPDVGTNPVGSLVFSYYMRPNNLVDEDRAATILSIVEGATTTVYTLDAVPANLTSFVQDGVTLTGFTTTAKYDILQRRSGHKTIVFDVTATSVDTVNKTITFTNTDLNDSIIVGDIIAFAGECIIPQVPTDLQEVLTQRVIQRCVQALGDTQAYQVATSKLSEMEKNLGTLVANRSEGNPKKVLNRNGILRQARIKWFS